MNVTVADCLRLPTLREAQLVAGAKGLDRAVSSVSVLEWPETNLLSDELIVGNELVISALVTIKDDVARQCCVLRHLRSMGAAGLVLFYVGVFIPQIDDALIAVADEINLPLIAMPFGRMDFRYSDMITDIVEYIHKRRMQGNYYTAEVMNSIALLEPQQRNINTALRLLSDRMRCTLLLTDRYLERRGAAAWPVSNQWDYPALLQMLQKRKTLSKGQQTMELEGHSFKLWDIPVPSKTHRGMHLLALDEFDQMDPERLQQAVDVVALFLNIWDKGTYYDGIVGCKTLTISFSGLLGGHSGVGINKGHANALVSIATLLAMLRQGGVSYRVASFSGGQAKNAIPAFGTATVVLSAAEEDRAKAIIETFRGEFAEAFGNIEPDMVFTTAFGDTAPVRVLTGEIGYGMVGLMTTVPNNVHTMSPFIDGLVESSANLGVVSVDDDMVRFTVFARSSVAYHATQIGVICGALANSFGFTFDSEGHVPGWAVNPNSKLTHIACDAYKHLTGTDMIVEPVHAGVECGAFAEKNPHLDMISIGPTLVDVHTPNEVCKIEDVKITTELLIEILERIAK